MTDNFIIAIEPDYGDLPNISVKEIGRVKILKETKLSYKFKDISGKERFIRKSHFEYDCDLIYALNAGNNGMFTYKGLEFFTPNFLKICLLKDKSKFESEVLRNLARDIEKQVKTFNDMVNNITFN